MATTVNNIKKGNVINYNGAPCLVLESVIRTPPNLRSFCQMSLRNLFSRKVVHVRTNVGDSYEVLHKDIKNLEFTYENQGTYAFMDPETFEQMEFPREVVEDAVDFLIPNETYQIFFVDGKPIGVELPPSVTMKVVEAPEALRGDTTGNVQKPVTLETGLVIKTPIFIKEGELVKVSTADKSYQGRA